MTVRGLLAQERRIFQALLPEWHHFTKCYLSVRLSGTKPHAMRQSLDPHMRYGTRRWQLLHLTGLATVPLVVCAHLHVTSPFFVETSC